MARTLPVSSGIQFEQAARDTSAARGEQLLARTKPSLSHLLEGILQAELRGLLDYFFKDLRISRIRSERHRI